MSYHITPEKSANAPIMRTTVENPVATWDITIGCDFINLSDIKALFIKWCKTWCFQKEQGNETGYLHWQCRVSLRTKTRRLTWGPTQLYCRPTSNEHIGDQFYIMKEDTRVEGPWSDKDESQRFIPDQFRGKDFLGMQLDVANIIKDHNNGNRDIRGIHYLYDPHGNNGKSFAASLIKFLLKGYVVPYCSDSKELMQMVCCMLTATNDRYPPCLCIDMPRSIDPEKLCGVYHTIEEIKMGRAFDARHKFKEWDFTSPCVWVFSNQLPCYERLSADRWNVWGIEGRGKDSRLINIRAPTDAELRRAANSAPPPMT